MKVKLELVRPNFLLIIFLSAICFGFIGTIINYLFDNENGIISNQKIAFICVLGSVYSAWFFFVYLRKLFNWKLHLNIENSNLIIQYKLKKLYLKITDIVEIKINETPSYSHLTDDSLKQFEAELQKPMLDLVGIKQGCELTIITKEKKYIFNGIDSDYKLFLHKYFSEIKQ